MVNLLILKYNNYNNRLFKMEETVEDYTYSATSFFTVENINFDKADGIHTKQTINFPIGMNIFEGDYLVVYDPDSQEILNRWFIIENYWNNRNQLILSLRRDLMVDFYETYRNQPMFIEKASLAATDPFIFNQENMTYNQIKTNEQLLKDRTGCGWIVGYYPYDLEETICPLPEIPVPDVDLASLSNYKFYNYINTTQNYCNNLSYSIIAKYIEGTNPATWGAKEICFNEEGPQETMELPATRAYGVGYTNDYDITGSNLRYNWNVNIQGWYNVVNKWAPQYARELNMSSVNPGSLTKTRYDELLNENNKIIKANGKFYRVSVRRTNIRIVSPYSQEGTSFFNKMKTLTSYLSEFSGEPNFASFRLRYTEYNLQINVEEVTEFVSPTSKITIPVGSRALYDNPYKMFAIPYDDEFRVSEPGASNPIVSTTKMTALRMATAISNALQDRLYDLQLVPYCPITSEQGLSLTSSNFWIISNVLMTRGIDFTYAYSGTNPIGVIFFPSYSKFSFSIAATGEETIYPASEPVEMKVRSETDKFRLCSPNYQGQFEFSAVRNYGVSSYQVDCWYKPGTPYIHIAPNFNGLYGASYGDARGLICGGDFSLPRTADAWRQYQLNNKNYQNIFDRQIENMEVNRKIAREEQITSAVLQGVGGTASMASAGFMVGGVVGGTIGGVAGAAANIAGAMMDYNLAERRHDEALDYTKDQFGYQLGNIQALPYSLTKVGAFTNNNKIFPFIEYYTATEMEKEALRSKVKYNGMTVNRIETFDYFKPAGGYIKGKLIRTNGIDDAHTSSELINELNKGVYV